MLGATQPKDKESLIVFNLLFDFGQKAGHTFIRISHFWTEKINILIQFLQLFSFVFACNYKSWPLRWQGMYTSSYLSIFALDFGSIYYDDIVKDSEIRQVYSGIWIVVGVFLGCLYLIVRFVLTCSLLTRVEFQRIYFKILHFFYLPLALGVLPSGFCQYSDCSVNGPQIFIICLTAIVIIGLASYPVYLTQHIFKSVISTDSEAYDEFIRLKEMEFLLGVSSSWLTDKLYLFSSYRSSYLRVYHRVIYYIFVLALVVIHSSLNTDNSTKLLIILCISGGFTVYITILPVYRCLSSSFLYSFCMWVITANLFMGYLKASKYDSQTMVDSNLVDILVAVNAIAVVFIFVFFLLIVIFKLRWDVGVDTIKQLAIAYRYLLDDLRNAQRMILELKSMTNFHFVRVEPIKKMENLLVEHYQLLSKEKHPLQFTVMEQLDILTYLRSEVKDETLLPSKKLERDYGLLIKVVNRRWVEQILFNPIKRRILLKLGVLKLFLGNRETNPFNSGETGDVDKARKNPRDYDLNQFYREFEDMESSREGIMDTKYGKRDVKQASRTKDFEKMVNITIVAIDAKDEELLKSVKKGWQKLGTENIPRNLYAQLFNE